MLYQELTEKIIAAAVEVHRRLGPGLLEAVYLAALCIELTAARVAWHRQPVFPVIYRDVRIGNYRPDLIVDDLVIVEVKSVARYDPVFEAQLLTYLRVADKRVGLILNFNKPVLKDGIKRMIL
jgi:GxxExxY protein